MKSKKISLSVGALQKQYGDMKMLEIAKEIGLDAIDYCTDEYMGCFDYRDSSSIYSKSDEEIIAHFTRIKERADELGLVICQTHGRIEGFKNNQEEDAALLENARRDLLVASVLGAPVCVIHAVTTIFMGPDCAPQLMRDLNFEMFTKLLPYAKKYGVKIATETFGDAVHFDCCDFFGNIDEFIDSYNRVCEVEDFKNYFTVCVDTGHSNKAMRYNNPSPGDVIRRLGKNVTLLHLNDNDTFKDQHKLPMTGTIDWEDVMDALEEVEYDGYYNMELALGWFGSELIKDTAAFAVKVMKNMLNQRCNKS